MEDMTALPDKTNYYIEVNKIKEFFYYRFIEAFKFLGRQIKRIQNEFKLKELPVPSIQQLGNNGLKNMKTK